MLTPDFNPIQEPGKLDRYVLVAAAEIRDRETEVGEKIAATSMYLQTPRG